nr:hypothetical protein [Chlamydiota bacterium]
MKSFFTSLALCVMLLSMQSVSSQTIQSDKKNETIPYEVVELAPKYIMGLEVRTSNQPGEAEKDIPLLWEQFFQNGGTEPIPNKINGDIIALYSGYEGDYTEPYSVVI